MGDSPRDDIDPFYIRNSGAADSVYRVYRHHLHKQTTHIDIRLPGQAIETIIRTGRRDRTGRTDRRQDRQDRQEQCSTDRDQGAPGDI